jgi:hypothetical protein
MFGAPPKPARFVRASVTVDVVVDGDGDGDGDEAVIEHTHCPHATITLLC